MSGFEHIKMNIHYRGDVSFKDGSFVYNGGIECKDMSIDPDLMTWSIFDEFCAKKGVSGAVEQDNDDPWSIPNAPKRWRAAQSQSTPPVAQSQATQNQEVLQHSSAPPTAPKTTATGRARGRPPGTKNGCGKGKGRGKGRGKDDAPKAPVFFMSPFTDKVFDVWRPEKNSN